MVRCAYPGCPTKEGKRTNSKTNYSYFAFPKPSDKERYNKWLHFAGLCSSDLPKRACLCSAHFDKCAIDDEVWRRNELSESLSLQPCTWRLKPTAIPTLRSFAPGVTPKRRCPGRRLVNPEFVAVTGCPSQVELGHTIKREIIDAEDTEDFYVASPQLTSASTSPDTVLHIPALTSDGAASPQLSQVGCTTSASPDTVLHIPALTSGGVASPQLSQVGCTTSASPDTVLHIPALISDATARECGVQCELGCETLINKLLANTAQSN